LKVADEEDLNEVPEVKPAGGEIVSIPAIEFYQKTYARSCEDNDQKAIGIFKAYETKEKHRRFQQELQMIKDGRVSKKKLDEVVKRSREMKYQGYDKWAGRMLIWFVEKKL